MGRQFAQDMTQIKFLGDAGLAAGALRRSMKPERDKVLPSLQPICKMDGPKEPHGGSRVVLRSVGTHADGRRECDAGVQRCMLLRNRFEDARDVKI